MAEITRRRSGRVVRGVFQILLQSDGLPAKDVLRGLEDSFLRLLSRRVIIRTDRTFGGMTRSSAFRLSTL